MAGTGDRYRVLTVSETYLAAEGVAFARLVPPGGDELPLWEPGAHVEIRLPSGMARHYSLCGDPADRSGYEIAVLCEESGRGGSLEFHKEVRPGWEIRVGDPRNHFALEQAASYLFLAGGVGITPILPMIRQAVAAGADWRLVYGGRSRATMAFVDEVVALAPERVAIFADDDNGRPDLAAELAEAGAGTRIYTCGPGPMLDAIAARHAADGVAAPLHLERFVGEVAGDVTGDSFEVVAQRSGVTVTVGPEQTILGALRPHLKDVAFSCEEGYCGSCETDVLDGTPDHRDTYLDEEDRTTGEIIMICVSRCAGGRLVLDL